VYYGVDAVERLLPVVACANVAEEHFVRRPAIVRIFGSIGAVDLWIEVVEPANPMTRGLQSSCDATADESCSTGNEDFCRISQQFSPGSIGFEKAQRIVSKSSRCIYFA